jgi:acetylornithine aminotransferase
MESLQAVANGSPNVVAVLVEPIQGEAGINLPDDDYLQQLRTLCDEQGWLLMLDEIQSGMGRSGKMFAHQHSGILPDVMTLAKGLGNGVPIGACLARGKAAELFAPGNHGSTFGGNHLACSAALAVVETLEKESLPARAEELGNQLLADLADALEGVVGVEEIRGSGLLLAIELDSDCGDLMTQALDQGLLLNVTAEKVIRLLPPLIMNSEEAAELVATVSQLIKDFLGHTA